jgi:ABC-type multidrug transport system ATPase subunit
MSGGMQRRLELACTLVHQPSLLILDEPTAGIDPLLRTRVWQEIQRLRNIGVTVLVTTQYVGEMEYCDAVALISEGQLVAHATPTDLRKLALGGEVLEVSTSAPIDAARLPPVEVDGYPARAQARGQSPEHSAYTLAQGEPACTTIHCKRKGRSEGTPQ